MIVDNSYAQTVYKCVHQGIISYSAEPCHAGQEVKVLTVPQLCNEAYILPENSVKEYEEMIKLQEVAEQERLSRELLKAEIKKSHSVAEVQALIKHEAAAYYKIRLHEAKTALESQPYNRQDRELLKLEVERAEQALKFYE